MLKIIICLLITSFSVTIAHSLEIDEKLTTRVLRVSASKKTVLLNRGLEDGLVVGDHAKFFLTTGVIARAMVVKASPTRSIWSVYRIINAQAIYPDKIVNIKISSPMRTTGDPTKSLKAERFSAGTDVIAIPLAEGANDLPSDHKNLSQTDREDIASLGRVHEEDGLLVESVGIDTRRTIEIWSLLHFNKLSTSITSEDSTTAGEINAIDFSLGIEKYFDDPSGFLGKISFTAFIHSSQDKVMSVQGNEVASSTFEYGGGASWHFMAPPLSYGKAIGFATMSFGVGSSSDTVVFTANGTTTDPAVLNGSSSFFGVGVGVKYYLKGGFGARALLDYYTRKESYTSETDVEYVKSVAGPRVMMGLSYRF